MHKMSIRPGQKRTFRKRVTTFFSICLFAMLLLLFRNAHLQIVMADVYSTRSDRNRVRRMPIVPHRGEVFDRSRKRKLITNRKSLCVTIVPAHLPHQPGEKAGVLQRLSHILGMNTNKILERLQEDKWDIYSPKMIKENVDFATIVRIAESIEYFPGVFWENRPIRVYAMTNTLSHVLGYTRSINRSELRKYAKLGYRAGSQIGKTGIERVYDLDLRGEEGILEREVDARNRVTYQTNRKRPVHGRPLVLTIDARLQRVAQDAMGNKRGAVVVTKPATGEVLALLSNPGYDANLFYSRINQEEYLKIAHDPGKPLFNRAIQANYPPSSVFKLITATAGLETGRINKDTSFFCDGGYLLGDRYFKCWAGRHGTQNLISAIMNSCNVYFYRASLAIRAVNILKYAHMFGFGRKTGIDLVGESTGFVPSRAWKKKSAGRPWLDGDTLNLAIGQGDLLVTPIQINTMTCAIYNEGIAYRPYLMKEIRNLRYNEVIERNKGKQVLFTTDVSRRTFGIIKQGMRNVVQWGTGVAASSPKVAVAGKTGTAQNPQKQPHAWFTCFAPADAQNPEHVIAVTVVCENAGGGGAVAAPVAACIIRAHFENKTIQETMQRVWKMFKPAPQRRP